MLIYVHPFYTSESQEFYCHHCDRNKVNSIQPHTGKFFSQTGHVLKKGGEISEEYKSVVFAICAQCLSEMQNTLGRS